MTPVVCETVTERLSNSRKCGLFGFRTGWKSLALELSPVHFTVILDKGVTASAVEGTGIIETAPTSARVTDAIDRALTKRSFEVG